MFFSWRSSRTLAKHGHGKSGPHLVFYYSRFLRRASDDSLLTVTIVGALVSIAAPILTLWSVAMAAPRLTSSERAEVYRLLFLLNRSFDLIVQRLDELGQTGLFTSRDLREMRGLAQEVQLEINTTLLEPLESVEQDDWGTFGRVRIAMEKRLRDPDDVFIHAEERRKQLAKQGKKSRR
jgi:hypothetical protein